VLFVHRSNRVERLVESLGDVLEADPPGPFESEPIVVQGRGMERWLSMELARRFGVWANPSFPFPRRFLLDLFERHLGVGRPETSPFEPEALGWAIAARLPQLLDRPAFAPLTRYLEKESGAGRLLALSDRIARTFDDYVVFRWQMIEQWQRRGDGSWQSILWRRLIDDLGTHHVAALARRLADRIASGGAERLPSRISIFGVSTLAPLYLKIFTAVAAVSDVHLFTLSPSREYWADLRSRREVLRDTIERGDDEDAIEGILAMEAGNRLLSSFGRVGREFQAVLERDAVYQDFESYEDPADGSDGISALAILQSDMLRLVYRAAESESPPRQWRQGDDSIVVHSCHGPMREVQVLHDQLLRAFASDRSLRPRDVIVMTPDIDAYAPFVEAVFEGGAGEQAIPYRISDRGPRATSEVFDAFREVLAVLRGRLTSAEVVDLLRLEAIRRNFGFADEDVEIVREWVDRVGIRWGMDGTHRQEEGQPAIDQNTWEFGLRRLFLGYSIGDDEDVVFGDTAPYSDVEGSDAAVLGRLAEFCAKLFAAARRLRQPRRIGEWPAVLAQLLSDLFSQQGPRAYEVQAIRSAVEAIAERALGAGYDGEVELATLATLIDGELRAGSLAHGFLSGAVTFCEMVPMRTIPFRIVCLIGMSDGAFPRADRRPDFDHIGQRRLWGDRSARDDDRYMFLEALLSARDRLYVSYVGESSRDKSPIPPSVVVQELLDALEDSFTAGGARGSVAQRVVRAHPLQAFSPRYFDGRQGDLFSYSRAAFRGAQSLVREPEPASPFISRAIDWGPGEGIALDDFVRFFENPSRGFLQRQLELYLGRDVTALSTREPVDLDALARWKVADPLLRRLLSGREVDFETISRLGELPAGALGRMLHDGLLATVREIVAAAGGGGGGADRLEIDIEIDGERLTGVLSDVDGEGRTQFQYSTLGGRQELALWIRHLVLCAVRPGRSRLCGRSGAKEAAAITFAPIAGAPALLAELVALYREGMRYPLPLFERASRAYAQALADGGEVARAERDAERTFAGDQGDLRDDYVRQVYGEECPFSPGHPAARRAAETAVAVYRPFLAARAETR
jgi:exodeoxyribonuclease V gamma subunit